MDQANAFVNEELGNSDETLQSLDRRLYGKYQFIRLNFRPDEGKITQIIIVQHPDEQTYETYHLDARILLELSEEEKIPPVEVVRFTHAAAEIIQGAMFSASVEDLLNLTILLSRLGYTLIPVPYKNALDDSRQVMGTDNDGWELHGPRRHAPEKRANHKKRQRAPVVKKTAHNANPRAQVKAAKPKKKEEVETEEVTRISDDLKMLRLYRRLDGKKATKQDLLSVINPLQKAILEQRIRANTPYASLIKSVQAKLVDAFNNYQSGTVFEIGSHRKRISDLLKHEKTLLAVNFIRRYINMHGKEGVKKKADELLTEMNATKFQPGVYARELKAIKAELDRYTKSKNSRDVLTIPASKLHGLEELAGLEDY